MEKAPNRKLPIGGLVHAVQSEYRARYWVRTSDLFGVNEARYHCANRAQHSIHLRDATPGSQFDTLQGLVMHNTVTISTPHGPISHQGTLFSPVIPGIFGYGSLDFARP